MASDNKFRVLIVDDVAETRENVRKLLQFEQEERQMKLIRRLLVPIVILLALFVVACAVTTQPSAPQAPAGGGDSGEVAHHNGPEDVVAHLHGVDHAVRGE